MAEKKEVYFQDPIHGMINFDSKADALYLDIINSKEFQRLHNIKQLGFSYLVFPGATHDRFSHSLGVFHLTRKLLNIFRENRILPEGISYGDESALLCAALLHDIGHPPFSHCMEKGILDIEHEMKSLEIIETPSLNIILKRYDSCLPENIKSILRRVHKISFIPDFISSQLDMDRLDYLLRDSHFSGLNYGLIDLDRILYSITIGENATGKNHLCAKIKGYHAIEQYLLARHYMHKLIYWHKTVVGIGLLLKYIIKRATELYKKKGPPKVKVGSKALKQLFSGKSIELGPYLDLDDCVILSHIRLWAESTDLILSDLCNRFLERKLFKIFYERPKKKAIEEEKRIDGLVKKYCSNKKIDVNYYYGYEDITPTIYNQFKEIEKEEPTEYTGISIIDRDKCYDITKYKGVNLLRGIANKVKPFRMRYCRDNEMKKDLMEIIEKT